MKMWNFNKVQKHQRAQNLRSRRNRRRDDAPEKRSMTLLELAQFVASLSTALTLAFGVYQYKYVIAPVGEAKEAERAARQAADEARVESGKVRDETRIRQCELHDSVELMNRGALTTYGGGLIALCALDKRKPKPLTQAAVAAAARCARTVNVIVFGGTAERLDPYYAALRTPQLGHMPHDSFDSLIPTAQFLRWLSPTNESTLDEILLRLGGMDIREMRPITADAVGIEHLQLSNRLTKTLADEILKTQVLERKEECKDVPQMSLR